MEDDFVACLEFEVFSWKVPRQFDPCKKVSGPGWSELGLKGVWGLTFSLGRQGVGFRGFRQSDPALKGNPQGIPIRKAYGKPKQMCGGPLWTGSYSFCWVQIVFLEVTSKDIGCQILQIPSKRTYVALRLTTGRNDKGVGFQNVSRWKSQVLVVEQVVGRNHVRFARLSPL